MIAEDSWFGRIMKIEPVCSLAEQTQTLLSGTLVTGLYTRGIVLLQ